MGACAFAQNLFVTCLCFVFLFVGVVVYLLFVGVVVYLLFVVVVVVVVINFLFVCRLLFGFLFIVV